MKRILLTCAMGLLSISGAWSDRQDDSSRKKRQAELKRQRVELEHDLTSAAQAVLKIAGESVVACTELRPAVKPVAVGGKTELIQSAMFQVLLREGLLAFPLEDERKIDVKYKAGKLPPGLLLSADDLKFLNGRKITFVLQPQFSTGDSKISVVLSLFDLKTGSLVWSTKVASIGAKGFLLEEICALDVLPTMNAKILMLASAYFGRQVDRGECWDLPAKAINSNGGTVNSYTFGKSIPWEEGRPGDVITFGKDGRSGGHVVVLHKWNKVRSKAMILHQNWNGNRFVGMDSLGNIEENKKGQEFALWRP